MITLCGFGNSAWGCSLQLGHKGHCFLVPKIKEEKMKNVTIRPKTPRAPLNVFYKGVEEPLGVIQYHTVTESIWDKPQYGFVPMDNSRGDLVMGSACLKEIAEILESLNRGD